MQTWPQSEDKMQHDFVVGLGGNLGERERFIARGVELIARLPLEITRLSHVYESPPLGPPQPAYLNAAVRVRTEVTPHALLDGLLAIEAAVGRVRDVRWGPRVLDLDILWAQSAFVSERLTIPHAQLTARTFALAPLLDVAPELAPSYAPSLRALGGAPQLHGTLRFDRVSLMCDFMANSAL